MQMMRYRRFNDVMADRVAARRKLALEAAARVLAWMEVRHVDARLVGSLAKGTFHAGSDVDFLILSCPRALKYRMEADVEDMMAGLPFDIVYIEEIRPAMLASFEGGVDAAHLPH